MAARYCGPLFPISLLVSLPCLISTNSYDQILYICLLWSNERSSLSHTIFGRTVVCVQALLLKGARADIVTVAEEIRTIGVTGAATEVEMRTGEVGIMGGVGKGTGRGIPGTEAAIIMTAVVEVMHPGMMYGTAEGVGPAISMGTGAGGLMQRIQAEEIDNGVGKAVLQV